MSNENEKGLAVFEETAIRRTWFENEWWFVLEDVVFALTDSKNPKDYIKKIKKRENNLSEGWGQIVPTLPVETPGGIQNMNCVNTEGAFRIIQSIPSKKAEPFKLWLAKVGYERIQEIEDPELAQKRMKEIYKAKGYSDDWIEKSVRGIAIMDELTDEWSKRGEIIQTEYSILTAEISKATFGITPSEYKQLKDLKKENLRDHMTDLELIFSMLSERATTEIARTQDAQGFSENKAASKKGGKIAGDARKELEKETGEKVVTSENYREIPEKKKRKMKQIN